MHASLTGALGLCRFQSTLRPSALCQCSTSSSVRSAHRSQRFHRSAVAVHSSSSGSSGTDNAPDSSYGAGQPISSQQGGIQQPQQAADPSWQQQKRRVVHGSSKASSRGQQWDYKYKWQACPSPCRRDDERCYKVEALIQNVLSYPSIPPKICRYLPNIAADLNSMTSLVEQMASHFGKELTLLYINKYPSILELDFSTLLQRVKAFRELCGVLDSDVPMMLRKNPGLVMLEPHEMSTRYDNLRELTRFNNQEMRGFVLKFPLCFSYKPTHVRSSVERFQQLCFTRDEWAREYQLAMTPSLMAYFLKDAGDQLLRFEYLASTGERLEWHLRDVMKQTDKTFRAKTKNFAAWEQRVKARRAQQREAAKAARGQQQQQSEADAIKAAILAADEGQQLAGSNGMQAQQRRQQGQQQQWQQQWQQQPQGQQQQQPPQQIQQ